MSHWIKVIFSPFWPASCISVGNSRGGKLTAHSNSQAQAMGSGPEGSLLQGLPTLKGWAGLASTTCWLCEGPSWQGVGYSELRLLCWTERPDRTQGWPPGRCWGLARQARPRAIPGNLGWRRKWDQFQAQKSTGLTSTLCFINLCVWIYASSFRVSFLITVIKCELFKLVI